MSIVAWQRVCSLEDIWPNTGVAALLEGRQIAVFRMGETEQVFAVDNHDPQSGANVISRGLIGNLGERIVVASPIYKHHYDLRTGECVEDPATPIKAYEARVEAGAVLVHVP